MANQTDQLFLAGAAVVALIGAYFDVFHNVTIPNRFTFSAFLAGIFAHGFVGGWKGAATALAGALLAFVPMMLLALIKVMGGGDVKLLTAVAAFASLPMVFYELTFTFIAGGVMGLALITFKGQFKKRLINVHLIVQHHIQHGLQPHPDFHLDGPGAMPMPYGPAIAAGSIAVFLFRSYL